MPANAIPIFSKVAHVEWVNGITAANTAMDGTGTVNPVFTADATNGSFLQKIVFRPRGTNIATVARVFINNGLTNATPANNSMVAEVTLPAVTTSANNAITGIEMPFNMPIPPGYVINVTLGTAVAGGYAVTAFGGDY